MPIEGKESTSLTPVENAMDAASIRDQLARILGSECFADSQRMARFLLFAVEETLNGRGQQLKENVIGVHVFDRPFAYDPRIDPIVRVEARRLRLKLRTYYELHGQDDALVFELPKGQYSPVFRARCAEAVRKTDRANTVAVLPFANLSADSETDFLSDGLSEDLIGALTRVSKLCVSAWTSAARMKGDQENLDAIRELLDVTFVVRGSIRKTRDRIRVVAHLIDTSTKHYIWSETFDRDFQDIFAIQDEITGAIVGALQAKLLVEGSNSAAAARSHNLECYQLCLKGRFHARERTFEGLLRSELCFQEATRIDPASALAFAGLADTYTLQAEYGFADGPSAMQKAKAAVERALELDPLSSEAQASHGLILSSYDWLWEEAEAAFRKALQLNPSYVPAHHWYSSNHLAVLGRFAEAEAQSAAAFRLDPLSAILMESRAFLRLLKREYKEAVAIYSGMVASDPSFYKGYTSIGRALLHDGDPKQAITMLEKGLALAGAVPSIYGALGQAHGMAGDRPAALGVLRKLHELSATRPVPSTCFALIHLGLGETNEALAWLEHAFQRRESSLVGMRVHPAFDGLRGEPRFNALVKGIFPDHDRS